MKKEINLLEQLRSGAVTLLQGTAMADNTAQYSGDTGTDFFYRDAVY